MIFFWFDLKVFQPFPVGIGGKDIHSHTYTYNIHSIHISYNITFIYNTFILIYIIQAQFVGKYDNPTIESNIHLHISYTYTHIHTSESIQSTQIYIVIHIYNIYLFYHTMPITPILLPTISHYTTLYMLYTLYNPPI